MTKAKIFPSKRTGHASVGMMKHKKWDIFMVFFRATSLVSCLAMISFWLYKFTLNEDLCLVDYRQFYDHEDDVLPVLSLCFKNPFRTEKLLSYGENVNKSAYLKFLKGEHFSPQMLDIDYGNVSLDLKSHLVGYYTQFVNGTYEYDSVYGDVKNMFSVSYDGLWFHDFFKCYALEVPQDPNIQGFSVHIQNEMFSSESQRNNYELVTFLHYPQQFLRSLLTIKNKWPVRQDNSTYSMEFRLDSMEVLNRRNKPNHECHQQWKDFDLYVLEEHTKTVGCKAPYQTLIKGRSVCDTKENIQKSGFSMGSEKLNDYPPPCRASEKISYTFDEIESVGTDWEEFGHFWVGIWFYNARFKEITQSRSVILLAMKYRAIL